MNRFLLDEMARAGRGTCEVVTLSEEADAVIDELRISAIPRYPRPFKAVAPAPFLPDGDTLLLMHLDGDRTIEKP